MSEPSERAKRLVHDYFVRVREVSRVVSSWPMEKAGNALLEYIAALEELEAVVRTAANWGGVIGFAIHSPHHKRLLAACERLAVLDGREG